MSRLTDINYVKAILKKNGFTFSKALGQNFLTDPEVCPAMAENAIENDNTGVIEIGPGAGVLTYELCSRAKKVVAIELDKRLLPVLSETLGEFDNLKIINRDFLKLDTSDLIKEELSGMDVVVCANLPYYITSPVIMKLLEERPPIKSITAMVQKEAAQRICAEPGTRQCGAVSAAVRYYCEPQILFEVMRTSFIPQPNVDSAVIRLNILKEPPVRVADEKLFFRIVRAAFSQRRKTISNSLSSGLSLPKNEVNERLACCGIAAGMRAEQLTMEQLAAICDGFNFN